MRSLLHRHRVFRRHLAPSADATENARIRVQRKALGQGRCDLHRIVHIVGEETDRKERRIPIDRERVEADARVGERFGGYG